MKKYGYIRVSSNTQDETRQKEAMLQKAVLPQNMFLDKASGKNFIDRSEWQKLLAKLIIGDVIVIKELDRLGRNNQEIKENYELIKNKGVFLEFIDEPILNTFGKSEIERELIQPLVLHLLGYIAEKERIKLLTRQKEAYESLEKDRKGRLLSRKKKKVVGRPNKIEQILKEQQEVLNLWKEGKIKARKLKEMLNISESTWYRIKQELKK